MNFAGPVAVADPIDAVVVVPYLETSVDQRIWIGCKVPDQKFEAAVQLGYWLDCCVVGLGKGPGIGQVEALGAVKGLGSVLGPR